MHVPNVICDGSVSLPNDVLSGKIVACGDCGIELEVTSVQPVQLATAPPVEEDWGE